MADALRVLFREPDRTQAYPTPIIEVRDNIGVKRFKFDPDYAEQLKLAMNFVSSTLNDYLQAAGKSRTFSFGRSAHYDMEFSDLVYRRWATKLVLESFEQRLLARIQLAKDAIESFINESEFKPGKGPPRIASPAFSTSTIFATDVQRILATDITSTQVGSPQTEDQRWARQLRQETDVTFSSLVVATARNIAQNIGLTGSRTEPPAAQEQTPSTDSLHDVTATLAELDLANPQPVHQNLMTQDLLSKWNAVQMQAALPDPIREQSGSASTQPLDYYLGEMPDLRHFYIVPEQELRAPSRTHSQPLASHEHAPISRAASQASHRMSLPADPYTDAYRYYQPTRPPNHTLSIPPFVR